MQSQSTDYRRELEIAIARTIGVDITELPGFLDEGPAAKALDVKPGTLSVWRSTGRYDLPYVKNGRKVRYPTAGLIDFMIRRTRTHT